MPTSRSRFTHYLGLLIIFLLIAIMAAFILTSIYTVLRENEVTAANKVRLLSLEEEKRRLMADQPPGQVVDLQVLKAYILTEIDSQVAWQWSHEGVNRRNEFSYELAHWLVRVLLLASAILIPAVSRNGGSRSDSGAKDGEGSKSDSQQQEARSSLLLVITVLAFVNLAMPTIKEQFDFAARQEAHDYKARQFSLIRLELEVDLITPEEAWNRYRELHGVPMAQFMRERSR